MTSRRAGGANSPPNDPDPWTINSHPQVASVSLQRPVGTQRYAVIARRWLRANGFFVALLMPLVVLMLGLYVYPVARTIYLSFTNLNFLSPIPFTRLIGLDNYKTYLGGPEGVTTLRNSFFFTVVATALETLLALGIALLLNRTFRGSGLVRTLLMLPIMFAPVVVGYEWRWIFDDQLGLANYILESLHIIQRPLAWLSSANLAMWAVIVADVWYSTPFVMVILLGGLQSLPGEPYEAARVDGASTWQQLVHITLPLLRPVLLAAILIRAMDAFQLFDLPFIMTFGGPAMATETINTWTYKEAFRNFQLGYAAAISVVALVAMLLIGLLLSRLVVRQLSYKGSAT